jgi:hypothetical protein
MRFTTLAFLGVVSAAPIAEPQGGFGSLFSGLFGGSAATPASSTSSTSSASSASSGLGALSGLFGGGGSSSSAAGGLGALAGLFGGSGGGGDVNVIVGGYNKIKDRVTEMGSYLDTIGSSPLPDTMRRLESLNRGQIDALKALASAAQGMSG